MSTLVESKSDENPPPFYLSLNIQKKLLHNCLLDSRASHNLMPKGVMEELDLEITREYKDLYTFDSKQVKCVGVIKDIVVYLTQLPMKSLVMDIIVVDIPPRFSMLLTRSWFRKLGGTLQMDLSYATIHVFGVSLEGFTKKHILLTLPVTMITQSIILSMKLNKIWGLLSFTY